MSKRRARDALARQAGWADVRLVHVGLITFAWTVGWTGRPIRFGSWATDYVAVGAVDYLKLQDRVWEMLKKPVSVGSVAKSRPTMSDPSFQQQFPLLWQHLTQDVWEDGSKRQCSSLLIFAQEGVLKAMLRDYEAGQVLWTAGSGFNGLLHAVEGQLESPDADWRVDRRPASTDTAKRAKRS